ncbi:MAG: DUF3108 domain-containing protein [bacterium]
MNLARKIILITLTLTFSVSCIAKEWQPKAFEASYQLKRNDKLAGEVSSNLSAVEHGLFHYSNKMKGTKGLASVVGANIQQDSCFSYAGKQLQSLHYRHKQKVAWKKKTREFELSADSSHIEGNYKKEHFKVGFEQSFVDPLLINLALGEEISENGQLSAPFSVFDKDSYRLWDFKKVSTQELETPIGTFETVLVIKQNKEKKRETRVWLAANLNYLPVKIVHLDKDERLESVLTSYNEQNPDLEKQPATGSFCKL